MSQTARLRFLFAILCLVWGTTWLAMKVGVASVPPGLFSGTRWTAAGLILLLWRGSTGRSVWIRRRLLGRLVLVAVLMISLNATIQLYGLRHIASGLASVITSGMTPIALLGFSVAMGQERFSARQAGAIALGLCGILVLFGPGLVRGELGPAELLGATGVMVGCVCYCAGSVFARPLMRMLHPTHVAGVTNLIGGLVLLAFCLPFEPGAWEAVSGSWGTAAWAAWLFLLLPGSLGATIIYFVLVRDWGASGAGTYAFVSPVIAVLLGMVLRDERLAATDVVGMALMLLAAGLVLRDKGRAGPAPSVATPAPVVVGAGEQREGVLLERGVTR